MDTQGVLSRLWRRLQLVIGWGRVTFVDDAGSVQLLQLKLNNSETIDDVPRLAEFGFSSSPPLGTDVVVVFSGGDRSKAIAIGTGHQSTRPQALKAGESMQYDALGRYVYLSQDGIVIEAKDAPVTINNASAVTINASSSVTLNTPKLVVSGDIEAGGNISDATRSMADDRSLFNSHTNGPGTSPPSPQQ